MLSQPRSPSTRLRTDVIEGARLLNVSSIDSTNLEAHRRVAAGERGPLWILADVQTSGRGRLGREWQSEAGNLYSTLVFSPDCKPQNLPEIGFVTAVAVADAVDEIASRPLVKLKWPNDCLIGGAKFAGILCETLADGVVAIGCGINVAYAPQGLAYPATALGQEVTAGINVAAVFQSYSQRLAARLEQWRERGFGAIAEDWRLRALGIGEEVTLQSSGSLLRGVMRGIGSNGALMLDRGSEGMQLVYAGDLQIPSLAAMRKGLS